MMCHSHCRSSLVHTQGTGHFLYSWKEKEIFSFLLVPQPGKSRACYGDYLPALICLLVQKLRSVAYLRVLCPAIWVEWYIVGFKEMCTCNTGKGNCHHHLIDHKCPRGHTHGNSSIQSVLVRKQLQSRSCLPWLTFIEAQQWCWLLLVESCAEEWTAMRPTNIDWWSFSIF